MILDSERQRQLLLQLIYGNVIPGQAIDEAFFLKMAITGAEIAEVEEMSLRPHAKLEEDIKTEGEETPIEDKKPKDLGSPWQTV
jgi:hypothetical protein